MLSLFLVSSFVFVFTSVLLFEGPMGTVVPTNGSHGNSTPSPTPVPDVPPADSSGSTANILLVTSGVTSIGSLAGFVSTFILNWRKEKREAQAFAHAQRKEERDEEAFRIDTERKRLENERLAIEIEKLNKSKRPRKS